MKRMKRICLLCILTLLLSISGCTGSPAVKQPQTVCRMLNETLATLGYDLSQGDIFTDQYRCTQTETAVLYDTEAWLGPNLTVSVIVAYEKNSGEAFLLDLGIWQQLRIQAIETTNLPDQLRITFADGIFSDGSEYYTRSFIQSLDYSLSERRILSQNNACLSGRYGMVNDDIQYTHRLTGCEVSNHRAILEWEILESSGWDGFPKATEIILPDPPVAGKPFELILPHMQLPADNFWDGLDQLEGLQSVTVQPLDPDRSVGIRLLFTLTEGTRITCRFAPETHPDWQKTLYIEAENIFQ